MPDMSSVHYDRDVRVLNVSVGLDRSTKNALNVSDIVLDMNVEQFLSNIEILWSAEDWVMKTDLQIPIPVGNARLRLVNVEGYLTEKAHVELWSAKDRNLLRLNFLPDQEKYIFRIGSLVIAGISDANLLTRFWIEGIEVT